MPIKYNISVLNVVIFMLIASCTSENESSEEVGDKEVKIPILTTQLQLNEDSVPVLSASIEKGEDINEKGFCWSLKPNPTKLDYKKIITEDKKEFSFIFSDTTDKTFYVRSYASNDLGTGYGNEVKINMNQNDTVNETVRDIDGNEYQTIKIGNKVWMSENLKTTHFNNGDPILQIADSASWHYNEKPAYSYYDNNPDLQKVYGNIYNGHAIRDYRKVCPLGWHVSTSEEWKALMNDLGSSNSSGGKMKEVGYEHWKAPNKGATNESGFNALPGGDRKVYGNFNGLSEYSIWWTSTVGNNEANHIFILHYDIENVTASGANMPTGAYVRCVKD